MKKIVKPIILIMIFLFLGLYFFYNNGYEESIIKKEQRLVEEKIKEYEDDLKNGINVTEKDYSIEKPNYSNDYTNINLKIGEAIENILSNSIKFVFRKMNDMVNK